MKIPKDGRKEQVIVAAVAKLTDASFKNVFGDLDLEKGTITIDVSGDNLTAKGTARLAAIPVELEVNRAIDGRGPVNRDPRGQPHQ